MEAVIAAEAKELVALEIGMTVEVVTAAVVVNGTAEVIIGSWYVVPGC